MLLTFAKTGRGTCATLISHNIPDYVRFPYNESFFILSFFLTVQLDIVHVPGGEGVGIGLLRGKRQKKELYTKNLSNLSIFPYQVTQDSRVPGAGEVSVVLVDAELQTSAVDLYFQIIK